MDIAARSPMDSLQPRRLKRKGPLRFTRRRASPGLGELFADRPQGGRLRAVRRLALVLLWSLVALPVQAVLLALPGRAKARFARVYHQVLCRLIGLQVQVVGEVCRDRPVLYVANHSSWLDILALGGVLEGCFVAKAEVDDYPLVNIIARLGRTVFVSRSRGTTGREADAMKTLMQGGDSLILFPEGTSNDGTRVLPFRSAFLGVAKEARQVQPISVVYDRIGGMPALRRDRPSFAWYGDMELGSHSWQLLRRKGARVTVLLHQPFAPHAMPDRKVMTRECARVVSAGAAELRQNRPVQPLSAVHRPAHHRATALSSQHA
jgi:1-acyl-sn-glycerol-3-phosphate acyltransferase